MKKIKITEKQADMLKEMGQQKVLKVTQEQYDKILEMEKNVNEKISPMAKSMTSGAGKLKPQLTRDFKKANPFKPNKVYEAFINELYGVSESTEKVYEKLHKLMEVSGLIEGNRLVKEKFKNDKNVAKHMITCGLYEMACGGSAYKAMESIEKEIDMSKDMSSEDLFKKLVDKWKENNSSNRVDLLYQNGDYKEAWLTTRRLSEDDRDDALDALAKRENEDRIEEEAKVGEKISLKDLTFDQVKNSFSNFYQKPIDNDRDPSDEYYSYADTINFPNPDDSLTTINNKGTFNYWKNKTLERYGDVELEFNPEAVWFDRVKLIDDKFKQDKERHSKVKQAWIDAERESGSTSSLDELEMEETTSPSSGQSTGALSIGDEPKYKPLVKIVPEEVNNSKYEYGIYTIEGLKPVNINGEEIDIPFTFSNGKEIEKEDYIDLEGNVQDNFVKIIWDGDKEIGDKLSVYDADGWQYGEGSDGKEYSIGVSLSNVGGGDWDIVDHNHYTVEDVAISEVTSLGGGNVPIFAIPMGRGSKDKAFWHPKGSKGPRLKGGRIVYKESLRDVVKKAKDSQGPFSIIAIEDNKVVKQEIDIKDYRLIPAYYREMEKEYLNAKIRVENGEGHTIKEDSHSETQWKGGSFVKVKDKCHEFPYCDEGPGAIELKKTKRAVISNDHLIQEVADKTGRSVEEVNKIISNFK
tara:strand:+ start:5026 stop:7101 length:2076 start_codon:yes stop_codon:yes gene_type:complete